MDAFTTAYLECMEFTDYHVDYPEQKADGFAPETIEHAERDCAKFQADHVALLQQYQKADHDIAQAGHDFWLTRNRHGAGFWDRDLPGDLGAKLTDAAHSFGSIDLYVGDDGLVYGV